MEDLKMCFGITGAMMVLFEWCARDFTESPREMSGKVAQILNRLFANA